MSKHCAHHCGCCGMSRRSFLTATAAAAAGPWLAGAAASKASAAGSPEDVIDIASFRPKPEVRIAGAIVRHKPPYWLGWPGTAYDVAGKRREYEEAIGKMAGKLGVAVEQQAGAIESPEAVQAFVKKIKAERPDAVLLTLQHLGVWSWAGAIAAAGVPTIVFAPVGTAFTGHVLQISRKPGVHVVSSLDLKGVEQALRMVRAKKQLEATRLLVVAGDRRSETIMDRHGTAVRYVPRDTLHTLFEKTPVTDEARAVAADMKQAADKIVEPTEADRVNAARSFITAKRLLREEQSNAITSDCLGMVGSRVVPTPPCMAASLFQDAGVTYGCEADLFAAMSLLLVSYLFDKPGFMNDPVPETVKNRLIAAHCTSGTKLNGFDREPEPLILRTHSESDLGVATQVLWREGQPVTLVRFTGPHEIIVDSGTVRGNVDTPPAGGCRTSFEIEMDRVEDCRDVLGFHQVVFYGNHRRDLEAYAQMYGLDVIHSPERAPRRV